MQPADRLIDQSASLHQALERLNNQRGVRILFATNARSQLTGSLTDGDIRRALLSGKALDTPLQQAMKPDFARLQEGNIDLQALKAFGKRELKIIPIVTPEGKLSRFFDFTRQRSLLPLHAVIMAGGKGTRLRPLTLQKPKPLLEVGGKPILQYNIERLALYGVQRITLTINYLGQQLRDYFGDGSKFGVEIDYIDEAGEPLGTLGSLRLLHQTHYQHLLVMNSDLLTNIDLLDFFLHYRHQKAQMALASVPYEVKVPYAVLETDGSNVKAFQEKPVYTYFSNAGIYLLQRELLAELPQTGPYDATDLMEHVVATGRSLVHYPIRGYWLDIGKPADFEKAQKDVEHIIF